MFEASVYSERRTRLAHSVGKGTILFLGSGELPMNYPDNWYPFRQDSSFLYYWGHSTANLAALIDVDEGRHILFADDPTISSIIWSGPQPTAAALANSVGADHAQPYSKLPVMLAQCVASGRRVHFEPPYRQDTERKLAELLHLRPGSASLHASRDLVRAIIAQRSVKEAREIQEIERALAVSYDMHVAAMQRARPGQYEREIAGYVEGIAIAGGGRLAFPCIFSKRGNVLHNHTYANRLEAGDLVVHDSGAASSMHYASDITRTIPVSGTFSTQQRAIYERVLRAQLRSIEAIKPGTPFKQVHLLAARTLASGLMEIGLMRGDVDEAVAEGAHALFFPHGLGHMMGLDVHDLEGLGEDLVGYDETAKRSSQFGLAYLRLGKALAPGYVLTVEPGCYFIEALIDEWQAEGRHQAFINYQALRAWRGLGGVRIEDDVLVTGHGVRVLGKPIPKTVQEVEAACAA